MLKTIIQKRIAAIRQALKENALDALMVSVQYNRYYLSGFSAEDTQFDESAGVLVISDRHRLLATDSRYDLQAQREAVGFDIVCCKKGLDHELPRLIADLGLRRIGFESVRLSHKQHTQYVQALERMNHPAVLVATENMVEALRQIKSEVEIQQTVAALRLAENAFLNVLGLLRPGLTEKAAAWALEKALREGGAQGLAFPVIVASGPNSALPHAVPTDRKMAAGEPILFDWGARLNHYCSDTTRTVIIGRPDDHFNQVYDTVVSARDLAIDAVKAGVSGTEVDRIARSYISQNGFGGKFGHGLGHGTGLAVHESPRLSPMHDQRLEPGMIVTVEPGIYLHGWGGVRMENQIVVRETGAEVLNDPAPFYPAITV